MADLVTLVVRCGAESHNVSLPSTAKVQELMEQLQALTNVHPRGQKLIFKGKILTPQTTCKDANLTNKSKLMMIASEGVQQGAAKARSVATIKPKVAFHPAPKQAKTSETMAKIGIAPLQDRGLQDVPDYVWTHGESLRTLDLRGNSLQYFPPEGKSLASLKRLNLAANSLLDSGINWKGLCSFKQLKILALADNRLTFLPPELQELSALKQLFLSRNSLETMPDEIGQLQRLEVLHVDGNRLKTLPSSIGCCGSLLEIDLSKNYLKDVPPSIGALRNLKILDLDNNALKSIPGAILKGCVKLDSLSFHGNEVTLETFREMEGWKEYDERRKAKCTKKLVLGSVFGGFDEGGDPSRVKHW